MPNNPLTPQELLTYLQASAQNGINPPALPFGYVYATPPTTDGGIALRKFDAAYISTGIIDPNRLGTGATGAGNLYLADDGQWKPVAGGGGGGDMYKCFHPDTELLTLNGWKKITDISFNDEVATLNQETKELEYQVPNHIFKYEYDGELLGRETKQLSYLVTPNHRMYVRKWYGGQRGLVWSENFHWERADEVSEKTRSFPITAKWNGVKTETNPFGIDDDLFLEFLGWFLAEGCVVKSRIYVTQTKSTTLADCTKVMVEMARSLERTLRHHQNAHFNFRHSELAKFLSQFGKHAHNKFIPSFVKNLPPEKLILFYSAYYKGDGHLNSNNITTVSKRMADDLQEIILKLGGYATITKCSPTITSYGVRDFYRLNCNFNNLQGSTAKKDNYKIDYKGFVHCVEVDNSTLYTRFNGKPVFLGNSTYDTDNSGIVDKAEALMTLGRNSTGATLYKGTVIRIEGSTGNRPNFVKAQGNNDANSAQTFGVIATDINNNSDGYAIVQGTLHDLDTRTGATHPFTDVTLADGDLLFLHPTIPGYVTNVKPSAPQHLVYVGVVTRTSPTNGTIVYRIQNGYELYELHDVAINGKANNDLLVYESSTALWKNKTISTIFGGTPLVTVPTLAQVTTAGNTTTNAITLGGLTTNYTLTNATPLVVFNQTHNASGVEVIGFQINTTVTASLSTSKVLQINAGIYELFRVDRKGAVRIGDDSATTSGLLLLGGTTNSINSASGSTTLSIQTNTNRTLNLGSSNAVTIFSTGNVTVNSATDAGFKLDVVGADSRFNGVRVGLGAGNIADNVVVGSGFSANTTGDRSVVIGFGALAAMSTVGRSTAVGYSVGASSTAQITAFGYRALAANTTGSLNTAFGNAALEANTTGSNNTAFGYNALVGNTTGTRNVAIGTYALAYKNLSDSIGIGFETIAFGVGSSSNNIAIGSYTLRTVTGSNNVGVGYGILYNTSGSNNVALGTSALYSNSSGSNNTALGYQAGYSGVANTTGSNNIFIGYNATGVSATDSNRTWIGNLSTTSTWLAGNVLIGTTTDAGYKLDVTGTFRVTSTSRFENSITNTSGGFIGNHPSPTNDAFYTLTGGTNVQFYVNAGGYLKATSGLITSAIGAGSVNASAIFQIDSTTKGLLQPRMTNAQVLAIATPATGLQAYDTTNNKNLLYNGTAWQNIATESWVTAQGYLTSVTETDTLQSVTNRGATTTNPITVHTLYIGKGGGNEETNTAVGYNALVSNTVPYYGAGFRNTAFGYSTLSSNTIGSYNTVVGRSAGASNTTGSNNIFIGDGAGEQNIAGNSNVYIGNTSGGNQTTSQNTYVGGAAGYSAVAGTGYSTYIGYLAGHATIGGDNVFLGHRAGFGSTNNNWFIIGNRNNASLIEGNFSTGNVMIGTSTDSGFKLDVNGTIRSSGVITATGGNSTNWNTAFGWGNHASAGYLTTQPWVTSGSNIYYSTGNVGIATSSPGYTLDVNGNFNSGPASIGVGSASFDTQSNNRALTLRGDLVVGGTGLASAKIVLGAINSTKYLEIGSDGTGPYFYGTTVLDLRFTTYTGGLYVTTNYYSYFTNNLAVGGNANAGSRTLVVNGTFGTTGVASIGTLTNPVRFLVGAKVVDDNNYTYDTNTAMVVHQTATATATLNDPKEVLVLARQGTAGQAFGAGVALELSRYENSGVASKTRLDFKLADGSFLSASTRVMTMLSNGNVGIGTTSPEARLHTNGNILVKNTDGFPRIIIRGNYPGLLFSSDDNVMQFGSITTVQEYGTNPYGNLAITSRTGLYIYIQSFSGSVPAMSFLGGNVQVGNNVDAGYKFDVAGSLRSTGSAYFATTSGSVGIGTITPNAPLGINGTGGDNTPLVRYSGSSSATFNWLTSGLHPNLIGGQNSIHIFGKANSQYNSAWVGYLHSSDGSSNNALSFGMYGANNLMNITGLGNVGIGTTAPSSPAGFAKMIELYGSSSVSYVLNSNNTDKMDMGISSGGGYLGVSNNNALRFATNNAERMRITGAGFVGIGTTSPSAQLTISTPNGYDGTILQLQSRSEPSNYHLKVNEVVTDGVVRWSFDVYNQGAYDNMLVFDRAKLGIGTSSPNVKVHIGARIIHESGYVHDVNALQIAHPTGTGSAVLNDPKEILILSRQGTGYQSTGAGAAFEISRYEHTATFDARTRLDIKLAHGDYFNQSTRVMTMLSNGNIGIGTTAPAYILDVNGGDINVSGAYRVGGTIGYTGVITIPANPPGMQNIQVNGGIITGVF